MSTPIPPPTGYRKTQISQNTIKIQNRAYLMLRETQEALRKAQGQKWPFWRIIEYGCTLILWAIKEHGGKLPLTAEVRD